LSNIETFYDVMRRQGITRRSFMKYCTLTASALGLGPPSCRRSRTRWKPAAHAGDLAARAGMHLLLGKLHPLGAHPLVKDVVLSMISLDYETRADGRRRAAAERALEESMEIATATTSSPSRATRP
jgi:hydrogenase small subunit